MAVFVVGLVLFLGLAGHSDANYCVCNSALSDSVLQKNIDYACGAGADCSAILQNGPCFNPNTVKDHCNYAVNSYYQRKGQIPGSCDFQGTATVTPNPPSSGGGGCVYQSSPSIGGSTTPSTTPTTGGTPTTPTTGGTTTPGTVPVGGTSPGTVPVGNTNPGTVPGSTMTPGFGLGPTGSGFSNTDGSAGTKLLSQSGTCTLVSVSVTLLISGLMWPRI
ncbi:PLASMODESMATA CALLOSE-BINDING PROTEIN 3 [Sesamum indicum]|uniref:PLASMODESMATA CALLOSE-BINDING PROTEIN 3 n=1 Tax=Sesamum indicum TaxID=4182 RepID=A0A6I9SYY4_SESIN|nr:PLASMODESMATA CALLOSE-BINDING PROTEIN 3 [Sesamum indicum]